MRVLCNHSRLKPLRKRLRHESPESEKILWKNIRRKQVHGHRFRRQYSIGQYVVDFCCPELRLVIEIDGQTHFTDNEAERKDTIRQQYIEQYGFTFMRFTSTDIYENLNEVLNLIYENVATNPDLNKKF